MPGLLTDQPDIAFRKTLNTRKLTYRHWLYLAALVLLAPALLINLGLMTFIDDEGIRSLVALEMKFSGNYITPEKVEAALEKVAATAPLS